MDTHSPTEDPNTNSAQTCCIRCAQLYKSYPDLRCDPYHQEAGSGLTRTATNGCRNCRTYRVRCRPVPRQYHLALSDLQNAAKAVLEAWNNGEIPVADWYRLQDAQVSFSALCTD